jgi:hypothetical protein
LPSQGGKLHRMVRIALRSEASFRVASVWAPVAFWRRSSRTATLWTQARGGKTPCLNVFPGCPQGPHYSAHPSSHPDHAPYPCRTPKPDQAQVLTTAPGLKSNLIGPISGPSSDTPEVPMKQPWLSHGCPAWGYRRHRLSGRIAGRAGLADARHHPQIRKA